MNLLGEDFILCLVKKTEEIPGILKGINGFNSVFLVSDGNEPLSVFAYTGKKEPALDFSAAAVCASAFLRSKSSMSSGAKMCFKTPRENFEVSRTNTGECILKINKCKHLLSKNATLLGCSLEYSDILVEEDFRAVHTDDLSFFDTGCLSALIVKRPLPSAIILTSSKDNILDVKIKGDFSKRLPSKLLSYAAASYNEFLLQNSPRVNFKHLDSDSCFCVDTSSVTITAKPTFSN